MHNKPVNDTVSTEYYISQRIIKRTRTHEIRNVEPSSTQKDNTGNGETHTQTHFNLPPFFLDSARVTRRRVPKRSSSADFVDRWQFKVPSQGSDQLPMGKLD